MQQKVVAKPQKRRTNFVNVESEVTLMTKSWHLKKQLFAYILEPFQTYDLETFIFHASDLSRSVYLKIMQAFVMLQC